VVDKIDSESEMIHKQKDGGGNSFRFNLQELGGALGDIGTLLPIAVALILVNGLSATWVLVVAGLFYIGSGLYYRLPIPVQPLKALSAIAISTGLSASVLGAAGLLMGAILLFLSLTNLIAVIVKLFPRVVIRGIQLGLGVILIRAGIERVLEKQSLSQGPLLFFERSQLHVGVLLAVVALVIFILFQFVIFRQKKGFPASLAVLAFGVTVGLVSNPINWLGETNSVMPVLALPSAADFWLAFTVMVIPQLPLTLGNAVVATSDVARTYFGDKANRVSPRALTASKGIANIIAGLLGAMPMCHGSGGLTAHYRLGARTGAANLMIGGILLAIGVLFRWEALPILQLIPLSVLGVLLVIIGVYHALLISDLTAKTDLTLAGTVGVVAIITGNLTIGFAVGILFYHLLKFLKRRSVKASVG